MTRNTPKKPKNHRQGIAGGFGDLHRRASLVEDQGRQKFAGCALKILHE
jgi:hypothetical protein